MFDSIFRSEVTIAAHESSAEDSRARTVSGLVGVQCAGIEDGSDEVMEDELEYDSGGPETNGVEYRRDAMLLRSTRRVREEGPARSRRGKMRLLVHLTLVHLSAPSPGGEHAQHRLDPEDRVGVSHPTDREAMTESTVVRKQVFMRSVFSHTVVY
jgi:hypothetical protein